MPLASRVPAVMCPFPSAVKDPMAAMYPEALNPLRLKAYCPLRTDSFPEPQADAEEVMVTLRACVFVWAVGVLESVSSTEKFEVPVAEGVPASVHVVPELVSDIQDGSDEPEATLQI